MTSTAKIIAWLLAGSGAAAAAGGGYYMSTRQPEQPPAQIAAMPQNAPEPAPAAPADPETKVAALPEVKEVVAPPAFDILRVEKDGSAVIAGSAAPNSRVEVVAGGKVVASGAAGPEGDFAIVLDTPLTPGAWELGLRSIGADGAAVDSVETGIVNVPEAGGELIAMVAKPGEASRVMQKPEEPVAAAPAAEEKPAEAAAPAAEEKPAEVAAVEPKPEPEAQAEPAAPAAEAPAAEAKPEEKPEAAPAPARPVLVQAVDVENGRIFVAGSGEPGRVVNVYLDDKLAGSVTITADGAFLLEAPTSIEPGRHAIRADMLAPGSAEVTDRAEVALVHEPATEVAQADPAPAAEPAPAAQAMPEEPAAAPAAQEQPAVVAEEKPAEEAPAQAGATAGEQAAPAAEPGQAAPAAEAVADPATAAPAVETAPAAVAAEPAAEPAPAAAAAAEPAAEAAPAAAVAEPAPAAAPVQEIRTGASVIIRRGDNLWKISRRMLGRGIQYTVIYEANKDQIRNPRLIYPGQVLDVPGGRENAEDAPKN